MSRDVETTIERLAHAFDPSSWKRRSLLVVSVVFALVATLTVVQRALVADSTTGWIITAVHGVIVVIAVPLLVRHAWREWANAQA
ncbi:MAG: hypothetical protein R8F63_04450 [Acidimicrobiales bacterium]|nr:hypothetical protein [Acidimicrobiales bacterium]